MGYGQSYYTLRSIYCDRTPPPAVHMHIRKFDIARGDVPIGKVISGAAAGVAAGDARGGSTAGSTEVEIPEAEREAFELWLRNLWREKDRLMARFLETGFLSAAAERGADEDKGAGAAVVVPVRLLQQALARRVALHALELPAACKFAGDEGDARELVDLDVDVELSVSRE